MKPTDKKSIDIQRVYDYRPTGRKPAFLVDRLWPRGVRKEALKLKGWLKDVGPSHDLRHWFNHDPARWSEFKHRYDQELQQNPEVWQHLLDQLKKGPIVLLYAARDHEHNNAVALKEFLEEHTHPGR